MSVPQPCHISCLWLQPSTPRGQGWWPVGAGALSLRLSEHSTSHSKCTNLGSQPAAFSSCSASVGLPLSCTRYGKFSNLCCWGPQHEAESSSQPCPLQPPEQGYSSTYQPEAVLCEPEQGADGKGEPSHRVLLRPGTGVQHVAGQPALTQPSYCAKENSSFIGSEHRNGVQL